MTPSLQTKLDDWLSRQTCQTFSSHSIRAVSSGCTHQSYVLEGDERSFFIKLNSRSKQTVFEAEAKALKAITRNASIHTPRPIGCGEIEAHSFLAMERLLFGSADRASWTTMGTQLAALHRGTAEQFGWPETNYIGASPQQNNWHDNWAVFFREQRLRPQLAMARQAGIRVEKQGALLDATTAILTDHQPPPSLLHGDLWSGNAGFLQDGTPVIYDPASYYGDRETDLAFSEFFGGIPAAFYDAYRQAWPLPDGYEQRKMLYNLYHVLNHAHLFGGGYTNQAQGMIDILVRT